MKQLRPCRRCGLRPAKSQTGAWYCYECNPGQTGPPPCRRCGSTGDYFTSGLCARCHRLSPRRLDSCLDCHAWGALRRDKWLCEGCLGWRRKHGEGTCLGCRRQVPVADNSICRLCHRQLLTLPPQERGDVAAAVRHGHQLFLAGMWRAGGSRRRSGSTRRPRRTSPSRPRRRPPVQLTAFDMAVPAKVRPAPRTCKGCGLRPVKAAPWKYCHACSPRASSAPPACRKCGSTLDYYTAGVCIRCHRFSPITVDACPDCHAWGTRRATNWLCQGCLAWRRNHPSVGCCRHCHRTVHLGGDGVCRLCRKQATMLPKKEPRDLPVLTRFGHQLFFAGMFTGLGATKTADAERRRRLRQRNSAPPVTHYRPVDHVQLVAFAMRRDYTALRGTDLPPPRDPMLARYLEAAVTDHAHRHGWRPAIAQRTGRGLRIVLALQDTPGAAIKASEVIPVSQLDASVRSVLDVLNATDLLIDDRTASIRRWFDIKTEQLPGPMIEELQAYLDVALLGSDRPPRSHPRHPRTVQTKLHWVLPALHAFAAAGHHSLREISRDDVLSVLPPSGLPRATMGQGLRAVFGLLKAHKKVFTNPLARIRIEQPPRRIPLPVPVADIRSALTATDTAQAAIAALIAFHALRPRQLPAIRLVDLRDQRLHLDGRVIPLATPVRERLGRWLDYRAVRWPRTVNPYLFIHQHNAPYGTAVRTDWITQRLGLSAQALREDRILHEAHASRGDVRRLCDLFGLSIGAAARYIATVDGTDLNTDRYAGQRVSSATPPPE